MCRWRCETAILQSPWADIVAFRNVVVHQYFGLSWKLIWDTATRDVPELERQVIGILESEFGGSST